MNVQIQRIEYNQQFYERTRKQKTNKQPQKQTNKQTIK